MRSVLTIAMVYIVIQVIVIEPEVQFSASAKCWSDGDPRISTFDGWYVKT